MKEFLTAALPFVLLGLAVAVFAAQTGAETQRRHTCQEQTGMLGTTESEQKREYSGNYMVAGMCIGLCLGISLGSSGVLPLSAGTSFGMLLGMCIGMCIKREE